jgi:hypothetical protein
VEAVVVALAWAQRPVADADGDRVVLLRPRDDVAAVDDAPEVGVGRDLEQELAVGAVAAAEARPEGDPVRRRLA